MTEAERNELIDLYIDDALPNALRAGVETYLAANSEAASETAALQAAVNRLKSAPGDRPDTWFVERALDRLLHEHTAAQDIETKELDLRVSRRN